MTPTTAGPPADKPATTGHSATVPISHSRADRKAIRVNTPDAKRSNERYMALARAAEATGDSVDAENFYQHADHYYRLMRNPAVAQK